MNSWYLPDWGSITSSLVIALVFGYFTLQYRRSYLRFWTFAWMLYILVAIFNVRLSTLFPFTVTLLINQAAALAGAFFLYRGARVFLNLPPRTVEPFNPVLGTVVCLWVILADILNLSPFIQSLPPSLLIAAVFICLAISFFKQYSIHSAGRFLAFIAFIGSALNALSLPVMFTLQSSPELYENLAWSFRTLIAVGLLLSVTETIRRELEVSESRSRALAESLHESESYYRTVVEQQGDGVLAVNPEETITFANPAAEAIFGVPPGTLTGRNLKEFVQQDDFVLIQSQTRRRAEGRRDVYELVILQPSGQRVNIVVNATPRYNTSGAIVGTLGVFHDITARKKAEEEVGRLLNAERRYRQQAETLREATTDLVSALELDQVLERVLVHLGRVVPCDSACIFLHEPDGSVHAVAGFGFANPDDVVGKNIPADDLLISAIRERRTPIILADAQSDPRYSCWGDADHVRGWLGIPLIWHDEVIGYLTIDSRTPDIYTESEVAMGQAFANQAAIAIQNSRLYAEAQRLAITDPLTGLFNRRELFHIAGLEFERYRRYRRSFAIVMMDMDNFNVVNNTHGHLIGDEVLRIATRRMKSSMRASDTLSRYGGDEFMAILTEVDGEEALEIARRMHAAAAGTPIITEDGHSIQVELSMGVAAVDDDVQTLDDLIERADQALYAAKNSGRNQAALWQPGA